MTQEQMGRDKTVRERIAGEEENREKVDKNGTKWRKVYFGGGAHFKNWLDQFLELYGEDNIEVEEMDPKGFQCYEAGGEKMYRIWAREGVSGEVDELL